MLTMHQMLWRVMEKDLCSQRVVFHFGSCKGGIAVLRFDFGEKIWIFNIFNICNIFNFYVFIHLYTFISVYYVFILLRIFIYFNTDL